MKWNGLELDVSEQVGEEDIPEGGEPIPHIGGSEPELGKKRIHTLPGWVELNVGSQSQAG